MNTNCPLISIITVSYNAVSTIEETMLSVINQSYSNIEYIIIDGGSTDGTVDIIKKYADKISYWISEPDKGIYDAMNKGVKVSLGDYVFFLGADDLFYSNDVLEKLSCFMICKNTIYYGNVIFSSSQYLYGHKYSSFTLSIKNISHQAIFYPMRIFQKYDYNTDYKIYADYDLNIRCYGDPSFKFQYIDIIVSMFNELGSSSTTEDIAFKKDFYRIVYKNLGLLCYFYAFIRLFVYNRKNG